jgi:hypothetical protein
MICKLCHSEAELQNSHVISEFQYKPLYDAKHRFHVISINPEQKERFEQKGFREKLLCLPCETKLSRWEAYAKKVIFEDETHLVGRQGQFIRLCLQCGHELINEKCKLRCPRCHYFMSCSDFDFAN